MGAAYVDRELTRQNMRIHEGTGDLPGGYTFGPTQAMLGRKQYGPHRRPWTVRLGASGIKTNGGFLECGSGRQRIKPTGPCCSRGRSRI